MLEYRCIYIYIYIYTYIFTCITKLRFAYLFFVSDLEVTIHPFSCSVSYDKKKTPFRIFPMEVEGTVSKEAFCLGYSDKIDKKYFTPPNYGKDMQGLYIYIYIHWHINLPSFLHNWIVKDATQKSSKKILRNLEALQEFNPSPPPKMNEIHLKR